MKEALRVPKGSPIARDILSYLAEHPQAQDSLEGIMQWWLLEREIRRWTVSVRIGLAELVSEGLILERKVTGGKLLYRINRRKLKQIRAFLGPAAEQE